MIGARTLAATLALLAMLLAAATADATVREPRAPLPLHATRGSDPGIFDSRGSQVLLRGVNVNQLGDYYQPNPAWPQVVPLRRADFRRVGELGFNSVRLLISWSALEPSRGRFDRDYIDRIKLAVGWAERFGLHVILDMHQDAWGKFVATPPEEVCPPGTRRAVGWDGAPRWATITDGASTCNLGLRETAPAVTQAWQSFYENRDGIRDELVRAWARVARVFATEPAIAGYDLLNEPNPGLAAGNDTTVLGSFYGDAITAIREAEGSRRRGFDHIVFFEPGVLWSALGTYATPPPDFTTDENIVFAPHIYAESISPNSVEAGFEAARAAAATYGVTVWSGEWGYFADDPADDADKIARYGRAEDANAFGGAWWDWKQACGDPHVIGTPGGEPNPLSPSLNRYACESPPGRALGIPSEFERVLARPTVRSAPGRITSLSRDRKSVV